MAIPFVPFPLKTAIREAKVFERLGMVIAKSTPSLKLDLFQAEIDLLPKVYASIVALTTIFYFSVMTPVIFLAGLLVKGEPDFFLPLAVGGIFSIFVFFISYEISQICGVKKNKKA